MAAGALLLYGAYKVYHAGFGEVKALQAAGFGETAASLRAEKILRIGLCAGLGLGLVAEGAVTCCIL